MEFIIDSCISSGRSLKNCYGSIHLEHIRVDNHIAYSKLHIYKLLCPENWGGPSAPSSSSSNFRTQSIGATFHQTQTYQYPKLHDQSRPSGAQVQFSYWDYINAFENILYQNNPQMSHTWFIMLKLKKDEYPDGLPNWFLHWWNTFGALSESISEEVYPFYEAYRQEHPDLIDGGFVDLYFFIDMKIPWIIKWEYNVYSDTGFPMIHRTVLTAWWQKYDVRWIIDRPNAMKEFKENLKNKNKKKDKNVSSSSMMPERLYTKEDLVKYLEAIMKQGQSPLTLEAAQRAIASTSPHVAYEDTNEDDCYGLNLSQTDGSSTAPKTGEEDP